MQKIKISKKNLLDAIAEFALLQSSVRYIHFSFDDTDIPDFIEVKVELLEGGTVEKCCRKCLNSQKRCSNPDCIGCHNKKEKGYKWLDIKIEAKGKDFNRETPKEKIQLHSQSGTDSPSIQEYLDKQPPEEEVKLPEKLSLNDASLTDYGQMDLIENRYNELLRYTLTQRADYVFSAKVDSEPQERDYMLE